MNNKEENHLEDGEEKRNSVSENEESFPLIRRFIWFIGFVTLLLISGIFSVKLLVHFYINPYMYDNHHFRKYENYLASSKVSYFQKSLGHAVPKNANNIHILRDIDLGTFWFCYQYRESLKKEFTGKFTQVKSGDKIGLKKTPYEQIDYWSSYPPWWPDYLKKDSLTVQQTRNSDLVFRVPDKRGGEIYRYYISVNQKQNSVCGWPNKVETY